MKPPGKGFSAFLFANDKIKYQNRCMKTSATITTVLFWLLPLLTFAQFGGGGGGLGSVFSGGSGGSSGPQKLVEDTSAIYHFYADNPNIVYPYRDSVLENFQQYDPIRQQDWDWAHLGNLGSAAYPLVHAPQFRQGVDIGLHQYDLYQLRTADVKFYKIRQSFSQGYFSQGANQSNGYFKVRFSRTFARGLNLSIEHHRLNDDGYFDHEAADQKSFALGLWYRTQNGRYDGFFTFTANNLEVEDNGGEIALVGDFDDAFLLDVQTNSANTQHLNREFAYTQYFYLNGKKKSPKTIAPSPDSLLLQRYDSLANAVPDTLKNGQVLLDSLGKDSLKTNVPEKNTDTPALPNKDNQPSTAQNGKNAPKSAPISGKGQRPASATPIFAPPVEKPVAPTDFTKKRAFTIFHQLRYQREVYKFWDDNPAADSSFYQNLQVDNRGLRYLLERKMVENTFKLQTFKLRKDEQNARITSQKDLIEVGLKHQLHLIDQDLRDTAALHNLYLTGSFDFTPSDRLRINTSAHLALLENAGDYRIAGQLFFDFKKVGSLRIDAVNQLYEPTFLQHRFYNTEREIWKNSFDKTLETSLLGKYTLPQFNLAVSGGYHLLTNYVYFDQEAIAQQTNEIISVFQLGFQNHFKFRFIHLHNQFIYQKATSSRLRMPELYLKHSLYLEGKIFKKAMLARIGVDARMWTNYQPYTYQPLIGQFHLQNTEETGFTPLLDAFFVFKLTRFRFFFKVENIMSGLQQTYYAQTAGYLLPFGFSRNGGMRLGISWRFVD